jgi:condensation domain-containing protein
MRLAPADRAARLDREVALGRARTSAAQARWWAMERVEPGAGDHTIVDAHRFRGEVDAGNMAEALATVYARHSILRARFIERDGALYALPSQLPPGVDVIAAGDHQHAAQESSVEALVKHLSRAASPMLEGELCRATVLVLGPAELVLVQRFHHSVMDGWSIETLFDEFEAVYTAMRAGESWHLPRPEASYDDYVLWEQEWLASPAAAAEADYWRTALEGNTGGLRLQGAKAERRSTRAGGVVRRTLPTELADQLNACAREHQLTLFGAVVACYALALARCSGSDQRDITIGTSAAARPARRFDKVVGCFANRVPIRVKMMPGQSKADLLAHVRTATREAFAHQLLPLEAIGRAAGLAGDANAPFTAFLSMDGFSEEPPVLPGAVSEDVEPYDTDTWFETALWIGERSDGSLRLDFRYAADLYDPGVHERLADTFATTTEEMVCTPELMPASERR